MFTSVRLNSSSLLLVPCSAAMLQFLRFLCEYMVEYILYFHYIVEKTFFFFSGGCRIVAIVNCDA